MLCHRTVESTQPEGEVSDMELGSDSVYYNKDVGITMPKTMKQDVVCRKSSSDGMRNKEKYVTKCRGWTRNNNNWFNPIIQSVGGVTHVLIMKGQTRFEHGGLV